MNITATLPDTPYYQAFYRPRNKWLFFAACAWSLTSTLNLIRGIKNYINGKGFDGMDWVWVFCFLAYVLVFIDIFLTRVTFVIQDGQLTVNQRSLFRKRAAEYEISQMQNLLIDKSSQRRYPAMHFETAGKYLIYFNYYGQYETIGGLPNEVAAQQLVEAIEAARVV